MCEKPVIYTVNIDGRDEIKDPPFATPLCDYVCFTDNSSLKSKVFDIELVATTENPALACREYKTLPHKFFPDYSKSLYMDGNMRLVTPDHLGFINKYLHDSSFVIFPNPDRKNVREEVDMCKRTRKADPDALEAQYRQYLEEGFPDNIPLINGSFILRRHNELEVINFDALWWLEIFNRTQRDEVSFPYVAWKTALDYSLFPFAGRKVCPDVSLEKHQKIKPSDGS